MKIKNVKLMLLGLLAMVGMNAYAQHTTTDKIVVGGFEYTWSKAVVDETGRSVDNIVYDLQTNTWTNGTATVKTVETKEATVVGVNASAANADVATITIPAEVTGDKGTYKVAGFGTASWITAQKNVTAVTRSLSIDITNFIKALNPADYSTFTGLTSLTIKDASTAIPALTTSFDGSGCSFKATLTTLDLTQSRINTIAANGLKGYTALTGFDFGTNINAVGANAFEGDYGFTTLTIPATVVKIGANAFDNMYLPAVGTPGAPGYVPAKGLTTLTINGADNTYSAAGVLTASVIPAAFAGNQLLNSVTVGSTTATSITTGAFTASSTYTAGPITTIDLSGATALATIGGAFPTGLALQSVKLYGSALTTLATTDIDLSASNRTLATLTLPARLTTLSQSFANFIALTEVDLSVTGVKVIPASQFEYTKVNKAAGVPWTEDVKADGTSYSPRKYLAPALTTVKLNAETTTINNNAFAGCKNLATVTGLNQAAMATIGSDAFNGTALTELDLSATAVTAINTDAFANIATLTSIKLPATVTSMATGAFANDGAVTSINLEDLTGLTVLNPIFHDGIVGVTTGAQEVAIPITTLTLPVGDKLTTIASGALQLLDIEEITIPASVTFINSYALQGCIKLKKFIWNDAPQSTIAENTFRGDDHLQEVKIVTKNYPFAGITIAPTSTSADAPDFIFKGNKKDELKFTVNAEDYAAFLAKGWTEANLKYCTLSTEGASTYKFSDKSKTGEYYYATYYNGDQATWFPADKFEVFSAVVDGSEVVLKAAQAEGGYYKVAKANVIAATGVVTNPADAVCVIRSKQQENEYELKNASFNNITTMPSDNELQVAPTGGRKPSRLGFQYVLGSKGGVVAFYRIHTGNIPEGKVYIAAAAPADRLNIVLEGEATAIQGFKAEAESNAPIYNLNGVRVNKAGKGVYIQNGKKFVK